MRCITANVLQTNNVDAQCDKLCNRAKLATLHVESHQFSAATPAFNLPHLHLVPPMAVTPSEFCPGFQQQTAKVPRLLCGTVCVILRLAVSVQR